MHQERYQVRFEWGAAGARRIAPGVHVVVVVDELDDHGLRPSAWLARRIQDGVDEALDARDGAAAAHPDARPAARPAVLCATEASAGDAAARVLRLQEQLGDRAVVAVVAAGSEDDDGFRTAVEDQLAAGAVIDALAAVGLDSASPEAAAACAAWQGLRRATSHLLTASASGSGLPDARAQRDAHPATCAVLREFSPRA